REAPAPNCWYCRCATSPMATRSTALTPWRWPAGWPSSYGTVGSQGDEGLAGRSASAHEGLARASGLEQYLGELAGTPAGWALLRVGRVRSIGDERRVAHAGTFPGLTFGGRSGRCAIFRYRYTRGPDRLLDSFVLVQTIPLEW